MTGNSRILYAFSEVDAASATTPGAARAADDAEASTIVYLASCEQPEVPDRERILRELTGHGYTVIGGGAYSDSTPATEIRSALAAACLSIHVVSDRAVVAPLVRAEFNAALDRAAARDGFVQLVRLVGLADVEIVRNDLIASAFEHAEAGADVEVLRTGLEYFKTCVSDRLRRHSTEEAPHDRTGDRATLYLMNDRRDDEVAGAAEVIARDSGLEVVRSSFSTDQIALRQHHHQALRTCDAAMIVFGRVDESWVRMKQQDLLKAAGLGRSRPMVGTAVLVAGEPSVNLDYFETPNISVIRSSRGVERELLVPFFESIHGTASR